MQFRFENTVKQEQIQQSQLISGVESIDFRNRIYILAENSKDFKVFQINFENRCSPFREIIFEHNLLAVGFEDHFYLYDTVQNINRLSLKLNGYFGHLYFNNNLFYVADACGLFCINSDGLINWHNPALAVDGVIINEFNGNKIYGKGEQDPPGGWEDFILDASSGKLLNY